MSVELSVSEVNRVELTRVKTKAGLKWLEYIFLDIQGNEISRVTAFPPIRDQWPVETTQMAPEEKK